MPTTDPSPYSAPAREPPIDIRVQVGWCWGAPCRNPASWCGQRAGIRNAYRQPRPPIRENRTGTS